jgi:hypothetical protein
MNPVKVIITTMKNRFFWLALASGLIVGLGQIIKGEGAKGLRLLLLFYFVLPSLIYLSLMFNAYFFLSTLGFCLVGGLALWTYNVLDAYKRT